MNKDKAYSILSEFLYTRKARIVSFEYFEKIFGNIVLTIEYEKVCYEFITDRGEIYMNSQLICDSSYHVKGKSDTIQKLIDVMSKRIFN